MAYQIDWNSGEKTYGTLVQTDNDMIVMFHMKSVRDIRQTQEQGIPIYNDVEYVEMFRPGELMNRIIRPVEPSDKVRFARQWAQFVDKKAQTPEGTPIDLLFPNNPAVADRLKGSGVYTIQQCANLTAHAIESIGMGGQEYVNRAKRYIESATDGKNIIKIQDEMQKQKLENDRLRMDNAELTKQLNDVISRLKVIDNQLGNKILVPEAHVDTQAARIQAKSVERKA